MQSAIMLVPFVFALLLQSASPAPEPVSPPVAASVVAKAGTALRLMVWNEVSTRSAKAGDRFLMIVDAPVAIDGRIVIPRGAKAWGEVVSARSSGMVGRAGALETRLLHLDTAGGPVPIAPTPTAVTSDKGRNGALQMVMVTAALTPWGPFARGNNARLKAGHIVEAVLGADVPVAAP
jgi:hypothetical protein